MGKILFFIFIFSLSIYYTPCYSRHAFFCQQDTVKAQKKADSLKQALSSAFPLNQAAGGLKSAIKLPDAKQGLQSGIQNSAGQVAATGKSLISNIPKVKNEGLSFDVILGNDTRFSPLPNLLTVANYQKIENIFSVQGKVQLLGIPVNVNYSSGRASLQNAPGFSNNLFKFSFSPAQFSGMFKSDLEQYYNLKRTSLGGLDMASYTSNMLTSQFTSKVLQGNPKEQALATYLKDPANVNTLLTLNQDQVKQRLHTVISQQETKNGIPDVAATAAAPNGGLQSATTAGVQSLVMKNTSAQQLPLSGFLAGYINNPGQAAQLKNLNEEQIAAKLSEYSGPANAAPHKYVLIVPYIDLDISDYLNKIIASHDSARHVAIQQAAHQVFLSARQDNLPKLQSTLNEEQQRAVQQTGSSTSQGVAPAKATSTTTGVLPNETNADLDRRVDSVASSISALKQQLQKKGFDVNKMLLMQQYLNSGHGNMGTSETAAGFNQNKPSNSLQSLFSNVNDLRLGSFGNAVPGNTQNQDVFESGTHLTFNTGLVPLTLGYGSLNDVGSLKDASFNSSVYNQPRSMAYISTSFRKIGGDVKLSVISSINRELSNSTYSMPTVSSNNVTLSLEKGFNIGNLGNVNVDVSKSATLNDNKYQPGAEAIIDRKAGLTNDLSSTLFESLAFGFTHHLDVKEWNASDNFYFNYAGLGYQNPGNNGYGGAKMKIGGNVKKSFYKNKLSVNLSTSLNNTPISYTTSDKWKNYQVQVDTRYAINKKVNIGFKYSNSGTDKSVGGIQTTVYSFQKVQLSGNANFKIGKYYTAGNISLGEQNFSNAFASEGNANMLLLTYTQSLIMNGTSLTATIFYNKELSAYQLIGNMLNSDISYQYTIFSKITLTSGLTYLGNASIARQVGIRQGVQLLTAGNFAVDTYLDVNKNLIKPLYPDMYANVRGELSLRYNLKL